jgi:hypothetical protein
MWLSYILIAFTRCCFRSARCSLTPTRTTLLSLRLPTCTRRIVQSMRRQPAAGPRSMPWDDETHKPWIQTCCLNADSRGNCPMKTVYGPLFPPICCCQSCVSDPCSIVSRSPNINIWSLPVDNEITCLPWLLWYGGDAISLMCHNSA